MIAVRKKLIVFCLLFSVTAQAANVGLLIMATGKYTRFIEPLVTSARKYFCINHSVTFFVFTDGVILEDEDIVRVEQARLGWPHDTLMRFAVYLEHSELFQKMDYLFALDADMLFVNEVGDEILGDRVATQHPGFVGKRGSYETNPISTACIYSHEGEQYFCGGFYGASREEFFKLLETNVTNILIDAEKDFIAVWHDESHLNRYFVDHKPTVILTPSYCYPESWNLPYPKKLLALDKNHSEIRE